MLSQNENLIWTKTSKEKISQEKLIRKSELVEAVFYNLDIESLKLQLAKAPSRLKFLGTSNTIVSFPQNDGILKQYRIKEASILAPELQSQFPEIRSYVGVSMDLKSSIRFSVASDGLHIMYFNTDKGTQFLDPYTKDLSKYVVYVKKDLLQIEQGFICEVEDSFMTDKNLNTDNAERLNDGNLRTFRLALACTGEYAAFHGGTTAGALAAMNTTMTRVNGVFENELSLTMTLVDNTSIIFLDGASDPYTNNSGSAMLGQNQTTCDTNIGSANYDIGHVFSTGGGGVAYLNSPCTSFKAGGVTGLSSPTGEPFNIDFVAHEMGHQYGANHTFNSAAGSCGGGNRNNPTAYEPGSGSTIMAYAGICTPDNVQNNSDAYFHVASLNEMWTNISTGASSGCASTSPTGNNSPTISALTSYNIPKSTSFVLKGNGNDVDGNGTLTYCWEQFDNAINPAPLLSTSAVGPTFRSVTPSNSPDRYMPALATVIAGSTASAWEVVPSVARTMNFELTVRDNDSNGGRFTSESMTVTTEDVAPFIVTFPNAVVDWAVGSSHDVTWDIGSTTNGTINCQNVNIKLSTDGGLTYPITLVGNTPNDGSQSITVPNNIGTTNRIMVEAVGNIFYDISNNDFIISVVGGSTNYCPSTYTNVGSEYILNVSFATINNASGDAITDGYEDFTGVPAANIDANSTYLLEVTIDTEGNFQDHCNVYIDWNQDFAFDQATEFYDLGDITNVNSGILSMDITVPATAINGNTRMRVNIEANEDGGACDVNHVTEWGETEDYTVNISGGLSVGKESFEEFKLYPNPSEGTVNISLLLDSSENVIIDLFDLLGRTIKTTVFENNNLSFNEQLQYGNLAKGVYLIKIKQGNKTTSKQLIIK
ncbi:MAG: M12 family metallo-peptidase [Flavobacteriaceae bacterium]|nr:M12 family metallo-peptidase [Flavobacteriaceae bacterium]